jgi:hypothetical protein
MIEAAVTMAVAILMTVAGFEMLNGMGDAPVSAVHPVSVIDPPSMPRESLGARAMGSVRLPHVDVAPA